MKPHFPISILDLVPVTEGGTPAEALRHSLDLVQHAEHLGYHRYWIAEHHNIPAIASAATAVVIGYLAAGTKRIRVGAGGIMLPNHAPLIIAEQFGTLEALYPGRIDLGLGRAPGTSDRTLTALRRTATAADRFPDDVEELRAYFLPIEPRQRIRAIPGGGMQVPLWILGSSLFGANLAATLGLPYAFASHFAPDALMPALETYRRNFKPSAQLQKPYVMIGVNVVAADTESEAQHLFTTIQQSFTNLVRRQPGLIPPPIANIDDYWSPLEKAHVTHMLSCSVVGSPDQVRESIRSLVAQTQADEIMAVTSIFDHAMRRRSYEILSQAVLELPAKSS